MLSFIAGVYCASTYIAAFYVYGGLRSKISLTRVILTLVAPISVPIGLILVSLFG
jgi:hypothetical protein